MIEIQKVFDDGSACERCEYLYTENETYEVWGSRFTEKWRYCELIHDGARGKCPGEDDDEESAIA